MYFKKLINVSFDIQVHLFLNKKMVNLFQDKTGISRRQYEALMYALIRYTER